MKVIEEHSATGMFIYGSVHFSRDELQSGKVHKALQRMLMRKEGW